jgi:hypothetical protein
MCYVNILGMHRKSVDYQPTDPLPSANSSHPPIDGVPASESLLQHVHIVMPPHANHMGNMFGGIYMECAPHTHTILLLVTLPT